MIKKEGISRISDNFITDEILDDKNGVYRKLSPEELGLLIKNNNSAEDWNEIFVSDKFDPLLIRNCEFFGRIRIGKQSAVFLEYHDLRLPVGLYNSTIISCDIGDEVVIRDVHYLSHYIINNNTILFNIHEMITTDHAKFGNGILKEGDSEDLRVWIEVGNENEGRKILPFENIIPADAYIWAKYRDDEKLMQCFKKITDTAFDKKRGYYGVIGAFSVVKNTQIIKDVKTGDHAYIKGANKLKNLTILSSKEEPSQIGEGVEMVNGIVGYGAKAFYGSKAIRFVMGRNTQLKYGARLINSILGDNSTVSCCELLSNLIFPFHEQHHNTSFLIASTVLGQSNIAAGSTIGSNHNSRAADGEVLAGRGFWPGLSSSFKHNSKFASFTLIAKGSYQYEMNIKYPFSLVSMADDNKKINIMPAYWFVYNMYAIERNYSKFSSRDKRAIKLQNIEVDYLAPDTTSEILFAINKLEALLKNSSEKELLYDKDAMKKNGGIILKPVIAIEEYKKMLTYYFIKNLLKNRSSEKNIIQVIESVYKKELYTDWVNLGGQLMPKDCLLEIKNNIKNNKLDSWDKIHSVYNEFWKKYPEQKFRHSMFAFEEACGKKVSDFNKDFLKDTLKTGIDIVENIYNRAYISREKDYTDPFRTMSYDNTEEMNAVLGDIKDNVFLKDLRVKSDEKIKEIKNIIKSL